MDVNLKRRRGRTGAPSRETLAGVKNAIAVATAGFNEGLGLRVDWSRLSEDEQRRTIELVREAGRGGAFAFSKLSDRERRELERLIERGSDSAKAFENDRQAAEIRRIAAGARRQAVRRPIRQQEAEGVFEEFVRQIGERCLWAEHVALATLILSALHAGQPLGPRSRVERVDGEPELILDAQFGFGANIDPEGRALAGWKAALDHLALNAWFVVDKVGAEWHVRLGSRARRAMRGEPPAKRSAA